MEFLIIMVEEIIVRGARVHNLKNININIPLGKIVAVSGVSGSGKSSLALGVLYAEGSRRYLEALSTYTRRRITQSSKAKVDLVEHVPAALALHQRPQTPGIRSTFGTQSELLNSLRLLYSRCGSYKCPNGHYNSPSINVSLEKPIICDVCGVEFYGLGAEEYAFNSDGACNCCGGTGISHEIDISTLVPDESLTLEEGAVRSWNLFGLSSMYYVAKEMGVPIDVPFKDLTDKQKDIVYYGEEVKKQVILPGNGKAFELNFTYRNAIRAVEEALKGAKSEKGLAKINKFLKVTKCPECNGARINKYANSTLINGLNITESSSMSLDNLCNWISDSIKSFDDEIYSMAEVIFEEFMDNARSLQSLGLRYLSLDRPSNTLSTGELQRVQLARTIRNKTTGVLYVLDEPSIGLHPDNIEGLKHVMKTLINEGNSIILVDHDTMILEAADYMIEIGPESGHDGGQIITEGPIEDIIQNPNSQIAKYITHEENIIVRDIKNEDELFDFGKIILKTDKLHNVGPLNVKIPRRCLTVITGTSGSGKTTLVLESLYPAIKSKLDNQNLPLHIRDIAYNGIEKVELIDSIPIGKNVRSTVATYTGILTPIRKLYASTKEAIDDNLDMKDFTYNTGSLKCPTCQGTGTINMDVQFLPDVEIECPDCEGLRYNKQSDKYKYNGYTIKQLMNMTIKEAKDIFNDESKIKNKLETLIDMGLGYLTLGEATPTLSGGEAQRLKLSRHINKKQIKTLLLFDEPTIGLHPKDVSKLIEIFDKLIQKGATLVVIEHDRDLIRNADYIIDIGYDKDKQEGKIIKSGTLNDIISCKKSITGRYL